MQQESLHSIVAAIDKQGWSRCASYTTELSLLHSRIGDKALKFILSKASLFIALGSGRNYVQITGNHSGMSNGTSDVTPLPVTGGPVLHYPPTSKWPVVQSAVHSGSRHIRGRSLRNMNRRRRRLYQKRKRVAARLRRRCSGRNTSSPAERWQLRHLRKIWSTAHKKKDIMYCSSSQEYLRKSHNLKTFKASRRGAVKLVKHVFIDKWMSRESQKQSKTRISRLPRRYQSVVPYFQLLLSNFKKKDPEDDMYNKLCNPTKVSQFLICTLNILIPQQLWGSLTKRRCFFTHILTSLVPMCTPDKTPFYAVHLDVTNSFDSLAPRLVYTIIQKKIVCQKSYLLRRYATVMISNQTIKRSFMKVATTRELCEPFLEFAKSLNVRNCILVDMVSYPVMDRLKILSQLKSHLFHNIVKFRGQFFRQQKGVPQGSCISSILCSFYYDEMVRDYLPRINPETELLIHYVDDFFLMTHDPEKAKTFLERITEYNCFANAAKTNTNFKLNEDGSLTLDEHKDWMAWCGVLINTTNLEVRSNYTRYASKIVMPCSVACPQGWNIFEQCYVNRHCVPCKCDIFCELRDKRSPEHHYPPETIAQPPPADEKSLVLKCQPLFLDCQVQSEKTVLCNVYQVFLLLAVKTHTALRTLQLRGLRLRKYTKFLHCLILQSARYFHSRARAKCREVRTTNVWRTELKEILSTESVKGCFHILHSPT
ncbi:Telomerase reverse transcriptase [Geodia barretti]|uniref:Telomerase reverse transcriptase n=1 Tax=Geodia barretti TaxID=519541 RepID=A0AA35XHU5_GEOBA|nr:Telomerase reverse transcriptase [Geodia barretti]